MTFHWRQGLGIAVLLAASLLAACGGGTAGEESTGESGSGDPAGSATVGGAAQTEPITITGVSGAQLVVPPGALAQPATVRIAADSSGAPALPDWVQAAGPMYAMTPHESRFAQPVEVRIPRPAAPLADGQRYMLAKASLGGTWEVLGQTQEADGMLSAAIDSFSFVLPVIYQLVANVPPWSATAQIDCAGHDCDAIPGPEDITVKVTTNLGTLPPACDPATAYLDAQLTTDHIGSFPRFVQGRISNALLGGTVVLNPTVDRPIIGGRLEVKLRCPGGLEVSIASWTLAWQSTHGAVVALPVAMAASDVVAGSRATVSAIVMGGRAHPGPGNAVTYPLSQPATPDDTATVAWERSDDGGASWHVEATSYEFEAEPRPYGSRAKAWMYWRVSHTFDALGVTGGRILWRARACVDVDQWVNGSIVSVRKVCNVGPVATVNVLAQAVAPGFTTLPRSQLVLASQTASFSAQASGLPVPTLQWQTRPANSGGAWTDVPAAQGGTSPNFTTPALALADNGTQYRVVASNAGGSNESPSVSVSVSEQPVAPTITADLVGLRALRGGDATFAVGVRGTEPLNYEWQVNGQVVTGQNAPVLSLQTVQTAAKVQLTVRNAAGSAQSRTVELQLFDGAVPEAPVAIDLQPRALTVAAGQTAVLAVRATGGGNLHYRWQRGGQDVPGAVDSPALVLESAQADQSGSYRVLVSNSVSSVTSDAVALQVNPTAPPTPLFILQQPVGLTLNTGQTATFAVVAEGTGALTYQWLREGAPLPGATRPALTLASVAPGDAGSYQVLVTHAAGGTVRSNVAALVVAPPPGAPSVSMPSLVADALEGQPLRIAMQVTGGTPAPRCLWLKNGSPIPNATDCTGLDLSAPTLADHGSVYTGIAYNVAGAAAGGPVVLHVAGAAAPAIGTQPADVSTTVGSSAVFGASASGAPAPKAQWLVNGQALPMTPPAQPPMTVGACTFDFDALDTVVALSNVTAGCNGAQVVYRVTNVVGTATSRTATLTVMPVPPPGAMTATQLVAGQEWSLALRPDRTVWGWGGPHKVDGTVQVGNLLPADRALRPVRLYAATLADVRQLAGWVDSFWALKGEPGTANARVLHWGIAHSGSDGRGADGAGNLGTVPVSRLNAAPVELLERRSVNGTLQAVPVDRVCSLAGTSDRVLMIRALDAFGVPTDCAAGSVKTVWVAGTLSPFGADALGVVVPVQGLPAGVPAQVIAAPQSAQSSTGPVMVRMEDGRLFGWGYNIGNLFGLPLPATQGYVGDNVAPQALPSTWGVAGDAAFTYTGLFATHADGSVLVSGRNDGGELGLGPQASGTVNNGPLPLLASAGVPLDGVSAVASTQAQVSLVLRLGRILAWGAANQPLQGGSAVQLDYPRALPASGDGWRALSAGHTHALVIAADGAVYAWGSGLRGALGDGVDGGAALAPKLVLQ